MLQLELLQKLSDKYVDKEMLVTDEKTFSWKEFKKCVENNLHNLLNEKVLGLETNRVAIISENSWQECVLFSCLNTLRIPYSGIDYSMSDNKKISVISNAGVSTVFYSEKYSPTKFIMDSLPKVNFIPLKIITDKSTENNMKEFFPKIRSNIVSFSFTSGTTNTPKCIYRTGSFDKRRLPKLTELYQFGDKDKFLVTMPFYHVSVIGWVKLTLVNGGTVVFSDFDSSNDMVSKITSHKITTTLMTPPTLEKVVDRIELSNFYNDSIRFIMVGGKNFPVLLKLRALKIFGNVINEYYGSSETGINTLSNSNDIRKYPESSGRVMDGSTVYIVDDRNNLKNIGEIGRIAIHSYQNATGYLNRDMEKAIINDKLCILTADYGYINSEGYIFIVQRKIFNSEYQSKNLFSLENRLRLVRYVDDVSIFQKEDGEYEVVLSCKDISPLEIKVLDDFVKIIVQPYFSNYSLRYVENISYSMSGKVKYSTYLGG